jgi:hypothetical protein
VETTITIKNLPSLFEVDVATVRAVTKVGFSDFDLQSPGRRRKGGGGRGGSLIITKSPWEGLKYLILYHNIMVFIVFIPTRRGNIRIPLSAVSWLLLRCL